MPLQQQCLVSFHQKQVGAALSERDNTWRGWGKVWGVAHHMTGANHRNHIPCPTLSDQITFQPWACVESTRTLGTANQIIQLVNIIIMLRNSWGTSFQTALRKTLSLSAALQFPPRTPLWQVYSSAIRMLPGHFGSHPFCWLPFCLGCSMLHPTPPNVFIPFKNALTRGRREKPPS